MGKQKQTETTPLEIVEPIGKRVLIRKDENGTVPGTCFISGATILNAGPR